MNRPRPTLSVCILARSSRAGLERLLDEVDGLADQIVIGVDEASEDETLAIAVRRADVVFRFEHVGPPVRMRLPILQHATSDWVLSLDEDEGLDEAFAALLPELVDQSTYTHYWFPRKWIVEREPLTCLYEHPWFPDWQLRLFRNDPRRVWHPGIVHSGYRVMGAGCRDERAAILHYEAVVLDPAARAAKVAYYREHGSNGRSEAQYLSTHGRPRRLVVPGPAGPSAARARRARHVVPGLTAAPPVLPAPPWGASLEVTMPARAEPGRPVFVEVRAQNTGDLAWEPAGRWPLLHLSYHVRTAEGRMLQYEGERFPLPKAVDPGEVARFLVDFRPPDAPGHYVIEWDLASEGERWFADCAGTAVACPLSVVEPPA